MNPCVFEYAFANRDLCLLSHDTKNDFSIVFSSLFFCSKHLTKPKKNYLKTFIHITRLNHAHSKHDAHRMTCESLVYRIN